MLNRIGVMLLVMGVVLPLAGLIIFTPLLIWSGVAILALGAILYKSSINGAVPSENNLEALRGIVPPNGIAGGAQISYDKAKWDASVKYDPKIAVISEKLERLGPKWVNEFRSSYLALNDKQHLPNIVRRIIDDARKEVDSAKGAD